MIMKITTPLADEAIAELKAGDEVAISGVLYTARDAAHKRMLRALFSGERLPFDIRGQVIHYVGPTPPRPGQVIGSAGPTSSMRMDPLTPPFGYCQILLPPVKSRLLFCRTCFVTHKMRRYKNGTIAESLRVF